MEKSRPSQIRVPSTSEIIEIQNLMDRVADLSGGLSSQTREAIIKARHLAKVEFLDMGIARALSIINSRNSQALPKEKNPIEERGLRLLLHAEAPKPSGSGTIYEFWR